MVDKVYRINGGNMSVVGQRDKTVYYEWPVIPVPPSPPNVMAVVLTENQSTTNTVGTGDATLLSLPVEAGKRYFVRARLIINGLRLTFVLPPDSGDVSYFGNGGDALSMHFFGCTTNISTMATRQAALNGNLVSAFGSFVAPCYARACLTVTQYSGSLTLHIGGTSGTLYSGSMLEIREIV